MAVIFLGVAILALIVALAILTYRLVVLAAPYMAGLAATKFAIGVNIGVFASIMIGILAAIVAYVVLCLLFAFTANPILRSLIGLTFVLPAMFAGYFLIYGIARAAIESETWQQVFSVSGAIVIGISAGVRLRVFVSQVVKADEPTPKHTASCIGLADNG